MTLWQFLALVWAVSAAVSWEANAELIHPRARGGQWRAVTIESLIPIYNTLVAWGYLKHKLKARM